MQILTHYGLVPLNHHLHHKVLLDKVSKDNKTNSCLISIQCISNNNSNNQRTRTHKWTEVLQVVSIWDSLNNSNNLEEEVAWWVWVPWAKWDQWDQWDQWVQWVQWDHLWVVASHSSNHSSLDNSNSNSKIWVEWWVNNSNLWEIKALDNSIQQWVETLWVISHLAEWVVHHKVVSISCEDD